MIRCRNVCLLLAVIATATFQTPAFAAQVDLSLNLEFNDAGDFNSGGTWFIVGKADELGLAGANMYLTNINFNATGFLAPLEFEVQQFGTFGTAINIVAGDNPFATLTLGVGVIGGSFPSSYVDSPNLALLMGQPNLGPFTGGVALATGTFNPGVVPAWTNQGANVTDANVYVGTTFPGAIIDASTRVTVRQVVPEPAMLSIAGLGLLGLAATIRRRG